MIPKEGKIVWATHIALQAVSLLPRGLGHAALADLCQQRCQTRLPPPLSVLQRQCAYVSDSFSRDITPKISSAISAVCMALQARRVGRQMTWMAASISLTSSC